jgi:hypothetical protein
MTETGDLIQLADRYGLPLVFLCFGTLLVVWAVRAVWGFAKPLASRTAESLMNLIQKQSDFIDTVSEHQTELKTLVVTGHSGHETTHKKLEMVHADVIQIREHLPKGIGNK